MRKSLLEHFHFNRRHRLGQRFDRMHGVETSEADILDTIEDMPPAVRKNAGAYVPTNVAVFRRIVRKSLIDPGEFAFIDMGSGKGRVVFAAADYQFRMMVGVEVHTGLYQTAVDNLRRWRFVRDHGHRVKFVNSDARTAELPEGNLFIFMYSPFRGQIFRDVAEHLAVLAREPGRAVVIAYSADWEADVLEKTGAFSRVRMPRHQFWKAPSVSIFYNEAAERMRR